MLEDKKIIKEVTDALGIKELVPQVYKDLLQPARTLDCMSVEIT